MCPKAPRCASWVHSERRLRYPMKLVGGQWTRSVLGDPAINEIGDALLGGSAKSRVNGLVYWLGSAEMTNARSYLFRPLGAFWGTAATDHQARICHSTDRHRRGPAPGT